LARSYLSLIKERDDIGLFDRLCRSLLHMIQISFTYEKRNDIDPVLHSSFYMWRGRICSKKKKTKGAGKWAQSCCRALVTIKQVSFTHRRDLFCDDLGLFVPGTQMAQENVSYNMSLLHMWSVGKIGAELWALHPFCPHSTCVKETYFMCKRDLCHT